MKNWKNNKTTPWVHLTKAKTQSMKKRKKLNKL